MRALIINERTRIMQGIGIFSSNKAIYDDLDLQYCIEKDILVEDEDLILSFALNEFREDLILLFGKNKPLYINPKIQVISTGNKWIRLINVLNQCYSDIKFEYDIHFMDIYIKSEQTLQEYEQYSY